MIVSSDAHIEREAERRGKTYSEVFKGYVKQASKEMQKDLEYAIENGMDIYWDQTNTAASTRMKKLKDVPDSYRKIAVFFSTPDQEELDRRLASREGKDIPAFVIQNMKNTLEVPTEDEGFDEVIHA